MARSSKDLFVVLAERHQRNSADARKKSTGEAPAGDPGATVGRWIKGAVRNMRGESPPPRRSIRRRPPQVPRGLLLPGWMIAGLALLAVGGGFVVSDLISVDDENPGLDAGRVEKLEKFTQPPGYLAPFEIDQVVGDYFYTVNPAFRVDNGEEERAKTAADQLARNLRARGLAKTRVRRAVRPDGTVYWAIVCYTSEADKVRDLETLQRLATDPSLGISSVVKDLFMAN